MFTFKQLVESEQCYTLQSTLNYKVNESVKWFYRIYLRLIFLLNLQDKLSFEEYKHLEYKCGYITNEGAPLACQKCNCKKLVQTKEWSEEGIGVVEYTLSCDNCKQEVGHWAYGNWTM